MTPPERTYAIVVGIERYEAGGDWDLDGAVSPALRIIKWLRQRDVPTRNITPLLSPLDTNRPTVQHTLAELEFPPEQLLPATVDEIRRVITEQLPLKDGDLLILFWSGHGVLDRQDQRLLFCANAGKNAKYNISITNLLATLSGKHFVGLGEQVIIVDACANFIQEMRLNLDAPRSEFAVGSKRPVQRYGLLAAAQGERALLDPDVSFGHVVADWLDQHAYALPPAMDQLATDVVKRFKQFEADSVTAQHPVVIQEILHGNETNHVFGGEPVPENVLQAARAADLTTAQLRATTAAIAGTPQLVTENRYEAFMETLQGVVGPLPRTDDPKADLLDLVSAVFEQRAQDALSRALLGPAPNDKERIAAEEVRRRWERQATLVPLLRMLRRTPQTHVLGALAETICDVPAGTTDLDTVLERLADLPPSRLGVSRIAEFVVRLQRRQPDLQISAGWFSDQRLDEATMATLRTRVANEGEMRRKLVIDLHESAPSEWQEEVTGYLGPEWCPHPVTCEPTAEGVHGAVVKIVDWARSHAADLAIGFWVGHDLLCELPEQWEYQDEVIAPIRLCQEHPVVLHAAERMTIERLQRVWDHKLASIKASEGVPPRVLWLDRDDATAIRRAVEASDAAYVAFTFVPEARPDPRTAAVWAAIAAGAPYVVWVDAAPADNYDLRAQLGQMLGPIRDFPATLLQYRVADPYMSGALRVIWDRLEDLPPSFDRLGEELGSNG